MAKNRSRGRLGALFMAIRQFVLQGLPTTRTRTSLAAFFSMALSLTDEDFAVDAEQILPFHAGLAGHAADEQRPIHAFESVVQAGGRHHPLQQRETRNRPVP